MTERSALKITLDLQTSHTQRPGPSNPRKDDNTVGKGYRLWSSLCMLTVKHCRKITLDHCAY